MAADPTTLVSLESFFGSLTAEITAKTAKLPQFRNENHTNDFNAAVENVKKSIEEAEDVLEQMELEIRSYPEEDRPKCLTRWKCYKAELQRISLQFRKTRNETQANLERNSLLFGDIDLDAEELDYNAMSLHDQRKKLLENTETLERSGRKLEQGHQLLNETEEIGAAVLQDLGQQRETIQRSRNRLRDTDDDLHTSSRVLSKMLSRAIQNKISLALVVIVIVLVSVYVFIKMIF